MTTQTSNIDPIVEILLERSMSSEDQIEYQPVDSHREMIETVRSIQRANFVYTNTILDLVAGRDDDTSRVV